MIKEYRNNDDIENEAHMILAVEDDEALLRLIRKNLQRASFHTECASNGAEAIALLSAVLLSCCFWTIACQI
ncbi:MAG: hypothetical protein NTV59_00875 [Chloroflexi bacterium]|nr:hypothetical protein [Chloroflexota bacterium]